MKSKILFLLGMLLTLNVFASSSGSSGVGNGGDPIRDAYILMGKNIIQTYGNGFLSIKNELSSHGISDYNQLSKFLTISVVHTSAEPLYDNQGSIVSAIGEPGSITLYVGATYPDLGWEKIFLNTPKAERLVLHELLRAAGVNDDDFVFTNIVLKDYGHISDGEFNFIWSKRNDAIIVQALSNAFSSVEKEAELNSFRSFSKQLIESNSLKYSEFIKVYLGLMMELDKNKNEAQTSLEILMGYRDAFRNLKAINKSADKIALALTQKDNKSSSEIAKYVNLSLRQIQSMTSLVSNIDKRLLLNYIDSLISLTSNYAYTGESATLLVSPLQEFRSSIDDKPARATVMLKMNQVIKKIEILYQ